MDFIGFYRFFNSSTALSTFPDNIGQVYVKFIDLRSMIHSPPLGELLITSDLGILFQLFQGRRKEQVQPAAVASSSRGMENVP